MDKANPQSIFDEAVRFQKIRRLLFEFDFLQYMEESDLERVAYSLGCSDLVDHIEEDVWLTDLEKTILWLCKMHRFGLVDEDWVELLNMAIRRQDYRLSRIYDDYDDGDSWKHV